MIIVNQEETELFNFDNTRSIWILCEDDTYSINIDGGDELGKYENEERAKEVLQEIVSKYRQYNLDNNKAVTILPKVYEMPKE